MADSLHLKDTAKVLLCDGCNKLIVKGTNFLRVQQAGKVTQNFHQGCAR